MKFRLIAAFACLLLAPLGQALAPVGGVGIINSYSTNFPLTENPLSESGTWINGSISSPRTSAQSVSGHAYGTMSSFDGTNFDDSVAILAKTFHQNQSVQGTLFNSGAINGQEAELVLRGNISASSNTGYETDLVLVTNSVNLVSWNGPPNNFTTLASATSGVSFANGAVWSAQIVGTVITIKCNGTTVLTHDTAGDAFQIASGSPGMGFWNETGSSTNSPNLGWSHFQASDL